MLHTAADLGEPQMVLRATMGSAAGWAGYNLVADTVRSVLPVLEKFGIATAEQADVGTIAERLRAEVVSTGQPFMQPPFVVAWAYKAEQRA
jgi:hypothetical protein